MTRRLYPEKAARDDRLRKLIEDAGWIRGEQEVTLHGPARIKLPAGIKLLVPEKVAALREKIKAEMAVPLPLPPGYLALQEQKQAGSITEEEFAKREKQWREMFPKAFAAKATEEKPAGEEDVVIPMAMIAEENDRWQASLHVVASGYLHLEENALPAADELIETLKTYGFWRNTGGLGTEVFGHSSYEWISPLRLEQPEKILSWAYRYSDMYSGKSAGQGFQRGVVGNVVVPGRSIWCRSVPTGMAPSVTLSGKAIFPRFSPWPARFTSSRVRHMAIMLKARKGCRFPSNTWSPARRRNHSSVFRQASSTQSSATRKKSRKESCTSCSVSSCRVLAAGAVFCCQTAQGQRCRAGRMRVAVTATHSGGALRR